MLLIIVTMIIVTIVIIINITIVIYIITNIITINIIIIAETNVTNTQRKSEANGPRREGSQLYTKEPSKLCLWVFIKGGCCRRGVQWMGVVLYNKTAYNIM